MNVFVHVKGKPHAQAEIAREWASEAEVVGNPGDGLYLISAEVFSAQSAPDASLLALEEALQRVASKAFGATQLALVGPAEVQLLWQDVVVNTSLRKQGLVIHDRSGLIVAAKLKGLDEPALLRATSEAIAAFQAAQASAKKPTA